MLTSQQIVSSDALLNALKAAANNKQTAAPAKRLQYKFKPMCIAVDHEIECKRYLSDAKGELLPLLQLYRLLVIDLATRGGKTTFFVNEYAPTLTGTPYIMVMVLPLRKATDQVAKGCTLPYNSGNFESQIMTLQMFETFAKTYADKLHFVHLVIDEVHELIKAAVPGYRPYLMATVGSVLDKVHKAIGLSGTPLTPFERLGFKTISVKQLERPEITSRIFNIRKADVEQFILNYLNTYKGQVLIFVDTKTDARRFDLLFSKYGFFTSHVTRYNKHENAAMHELLETDNLPDDLVLFSTAVLENGITVRNARVLYINSGGGCDVARFWQSLSRNTADGVRELDYLHVVRPYKPDAGDTDAKPLQDFDFDAAEQEKAESVAYLDMQRNYVTMHAQKVKADAKIYKLIKQEELPTGYFFNKVLNIYDFSIFPILGEQYQRITDIDDLTYIADFLEKNTKLLGIFRERYFGKDGDLDTYSEQAAYELKEQRRNDTKTAITWLKSEKDRPIFLGIIKGKTDNQALKNALYAYKEPQSIAPEFSVPINRNLAIFVQVAYQYVELKKVLFGAMKNDQICKIAGLSGDKFKHQLKRIGVQVYEALFSVYGDGVPSEITDHLAILKAEKYNEMYRVKLHILAALSNEKDTAIQGGEQVQSEPLNGGYILPKTAAKILCDLDSNFEGKAEIISGKAILAYLKVLFNVTVTRYGKEQAKLYHIKQVAKDAYFDSSLFLSLFKP